MLPPSDYKLNVTLVGTTLSVRVAQIQFLGHRQNAGNGFAFAGSPLPSRSVDVLNGVDLEHRAESLQRNGVDHFS
jgi:hypothetical protein